MRYDSYTRRRMWTVTYRTYSASYRTSTSYLLMMVWIFTWVWVLPCDVCPLAGCRARVVKDEPPWINCVSRWGSFLRWCWWSLHCRRAVFLTNNKCVLEFLRCIWWLGFVAFGKVWMAELVVIMLAEFWLLYGVFRWLGGGWFCVCEWMRTSRW